MKSFLKFHFDFVQDIIIVNIVNSSAFATTIINMTSTKTMCGKVEKKRFLQFFDRREHVGMPVHLSNIIHLS